MFEDYDFNVPRDEKGNIRSLTLRTVRAEGEEPLIVGVKECISKTNKDGVITSSTVSTFCLNVEYNSGWAVTRYCEFNENGERLYHNINSIESIRVVEDGVEKLSIDNGYDENNELYLGISRVGGAMFSFNVRSNNNVYPFDNFRVSPDVKSFLGLHYNPETSEFHNGSGPNVVQR